MVVIKPKVIIPNFFYLPGNNKNFFQLNQIRHLMNPEKAFGGPWRAENECHKWHSTKYGHWFGIHIQGVSGITVHTHVRSRIELS